MPNQLLRQSLQELSQRILYLIDHFTHLILGFIRNPSTHSLLQLNPQTVTTKPIYYRNIRSIVYEVRFQNLISFLKQLPLARATRLKTSHVVSTRIFIFKTRRYCKATWSSIHVTILYQCVKFGESCFLFKTNSITVKIICN